MTDLQRHKEEFSSKGYTIINGVFTDENLAALIRIIEETDISGPGFSKSTELFAIRQFLKQVPQAAPLIFTETFCALIHTIFGRDYFLVKSIYFDNPGSSNWFVSYHQDLTISVDRKTETEGYGPWSVKQDQYAVQPPLAILESNFTIRIHLNDTDAENGALRVIPGSHTKGIQRPASINLDEVTEEICAVAKGGIMFMHPLLLHASSRTKNNKKRRVIHTEFSKSALAHRLQWAELLRLTSGGDFRPLA